MMGADDEVCTGLSTLSKPLTNLKGPVWLNPPLVGSPHYKYPHPRRKRGALKAWHVSVRDPVHTQAVPTKPCAKSVILHWRVKSTFEQGW